MKLWMESRIESNFYWLKKINLPQTMQKLYHSLVTETLRILTHWFKMFLLKSFVIILNLFPKASTKKPFYQISFNTRLFCNTFWWIYKIVLYLITSNILKWEFTGSNMHIQKLYILCYGVRGISMSSYCALVMNILTPLWKNSYNYIFKLTSYCN